MEPTQKPAETVQVKILKHVGPYVPGQVVELDKETAEQICASGGYNDGHQQVIHQKAMLLSDYEGLSKEAASPGEMTMKDMADRHMKNVVDSKTGESVLDDLAKTAAAEDANLKGVPVAAGEPFVTTGGITPPTTVIPSLAKANKRPHVSAESLFPKDKEESKAEAKKEEAPKLDPKKK